MVNEFCGKWVIYTMITPFSCKFFDNNKIPRNIKKRLALNVPYDWVLFSHPRVRRDFASQKGKKMVHSSSPLFCLAQRKIMFHASTKTSRVLAGWRGFVVLVIINTSLVWIPPSNKIIKNEVITAHHNFNLPNLFISTLSCSHISFSSLSSFVCTQEEAEAKKSQDLRVSSKVTLYGKVLLWIFHSGKTSFLIYIKTDLKLFFYCFPRKSLCRLPFKRDKLFKLL